MESVIFDFDKYITQVEAQVSVPVFVVGLILTAITAYILKKVYVQFGQTLSNRSDLGNIFIPIAMTTMVIITIVKSSLALSLGLVGALSIVRFRAAIKEPEELVYLFICIALGLGFGANQAVVTIIGFCMIVITIALLRRSAFKVDKANVLYLTISTRSEAKLDINGILDVLKENALEVDLKRLDEGPITNEASFIVSFKNDDELLGLRDNLYKLDDQLELTFLDNSKIF
jgi:hypothetical protein